MKLLAAVVALLLASPSSPADEAPQKASVGALQPLRITRSGTQPSQKAPAEFFTGSVAPTRCSGRPTRRAYLPPT